MISPEHECGPDCLGHDYIERMERGLAGPFWTVPQGLSREEFLQFMKDVCAGKIAPDDHRDRRALGAKP